jgi:hypothetical protein
MSLHEGLDLDPTDPLYILITSYPDPDENPEGEVARNAIIGNLKKSLQGKYEDWSHNGGSTWKNFNGIFYTDTVNKPPQYTDDVNSQTGLTDSGWWNNFSKAVLCASIHANCTSFAVDIDKIHSDLSSFNSKLKSSGFFNLYTYIIKEHYIKSVLSYTGDFTEAKNAYIANICTQDWVNYKMFLYNNEKWPDGEWEEFHHWDKLKALGASDDEITSTIKDLRDGRNSIIGIS